MSSLRIRPYKASDMPELLTICSKNVPDYFAAAEVADLAAYLEKEREVYFVAERGGRIVGGGGINFMQDRNTAFISWDLVDPEFHGRGVGSELLLHRISVIKERPNGRNIVVRTSQKVWGFYRKHGFQLKFVKENFCAEGFDLYHMEFAGEKES